MNYTVEETTIIPEGAAGEETPKRRVGLLWYLLLGVYFGVVLTKSEVISWFRIQEMFRFQSFHMYGIIGAAVVVAAISVALIKKYRIRSLEGEDIYIPPKELGKGYRYGIGGILFGLGWALTGACPGPLFALVGNGVLVMTVAILSAVLGTWAYAALRPRLPH
ncbi:YeeE/YedE family protein [Rhodocaloribacter litoris]|uniref:DUF6691 family protein n=1 Tax=Rhodocaloribacter litoris TaxID=2558931 RepID=UPI0014248F1F|nr:DUF6691 family protein [Rhodocaloribacter litoris]QXD16800.1 YeeE/YedE family protein [Rhodocaloribacter litoris]